MPEIKKIHCNTCNLETNHELISNHDRDYVEFEEINGEKAIGWYEKTKYGFWVCRGCDTASLEEKWHCHGMYDQNGDEIHSYAYFPERRNTSIRDPKKFLHIEKKLDSTYQEIIKAYNQSLDIVSAMGVRALLEGICVEEGIEDKQAYTLKGKIEKLQTASHIPESIIGGLMNLKIIGDDAAHRLISTDRYSIMLAIDLLEALLTHLYEAKFDLQHRAELVKKRITKI